jgi:hypothetical protein
MFCSQCATPLSESDVYCPKCSKPVASFHVSGNVPQVEPMGETPTVVHPRTVPPRSFGWPAVLLGAVAGSVATLVIGGLFFLIYYESNRTNKSETAAVTNQNAAKPAETSKPTPTPARTETPANDDQAENAPESTNPKTLIVNDQFPVPARRTVTFPFSVSKETQVTGGFVAYGGSNDVDASLLDERGGAYYHSGYTSKGKINVTVPPGKYTLVFDNRRAWFTDKSVAAEIYYQEK